jgi:hypothetical protein
LTTATLSVDFALEDRVVTSLLFLLFLIIVLLTGTMCAGWNPEAGLTVLERSILTGEIMTLAVALNVVAAALAKRAGTSRELGADSSVLGYPVGESVFAVLDDSLGGFVAVVGLAGLAWGDWGIVDELKEVLSVTGNDSNLLTVLLEGVELVLKGGLQLLTGNVGKLGLSNKGFGFSADKFLLEDDNLWGVWLLVLKLSNLVGDLLLA